MRNDQSFGLVCFVQIEYQKCDLLFLLGYYVKHASLTFEITRVETQKKAAETKVV